MKVATLLATLVASLLATSVWAADADNDGIEDAIDPNPGVADAKTARTGTGYTMTVLGSNRVISMELPQADYDKWADGQITGNVVQPKLLRQIYEQFRDAFDFVIVISDEATTRMGVGYSGQTLNYSSNVQGIGVDPFDVTALAGSAGKLQSVIHFPNRTRFREGPLLHEILHRWGSFLTSVPTLNAHWYFAGTGGQHGGWEPGTLKDLGGGIYDADGPDGNTYWGVSYPGFGFGKLDLYLMGLIPPSEVPDIQYAENGQFEDGPTGKFRATAIKTVTINQIVAADGARIPNHQNSQKFFHTLYVVLTTSPLPNDRWAVFDREAYDFGLGGDDGNPDFFNFHEATGGRARMTFDHLDYDLKTFNQPVISGPDLPTVGVPNAYTYNAVSDVTGYDLRVRRYVPFTLTDGAENGAGNFIPTLTGGYQLIRDFFPHSGNKVFRMVHVDGVAQYLQLKNTLRPGAQTKLRFYSRLGLSLPGQVARVEVRVDGDGWKSVFSQAGTNSEEFDYTLKEVSLAAYAGQTVDLRFNWDVTGGYYIGAADNVGWHIDDIEIVDTEEASSTVVSDLAMAAGFDFTPPVQSRFGLQVRGRLGPRLLTWGPEKTVGIPGGGGNAPPIANDDTIDIRGAGPVDLTANDVDFDGDRLRVTAVTQAAKGKVKLQSGKVIYMPGATFDGQDTFTYTISDGNGGSDTGNVTVRNPFLTMRGGFSAAVTLAGAPVGRLDLTVSSGGELSGKLLLNGKTYKVKGSLAFNGTTTITIKRPGQPSLTVSLSDLLAGGFATLSGTLSDGATTFTIAADTVFATGPSALAPKGRYTFFLPGNGAGGAPAGGGFATGSMNAKGALKLAGQLPDATPFSVAVRLRANNTVLVNLPLYKKPKGYLYGTLTFASTAGSDVAGALALNKPAQTPADPLFPVGFNTTIAATGAIYTPPPAGTRAIDYPDPNNAGADVTFAAGGLPADLTQAVLVSAADKVTADGTNTLALKLTINRATGFFSGMFTPAGGAKTSFGGVFSQKADVGRGLFRGSAETGRVTFQP